MGINEARRREMLMVCGSSGVAEISQLKNNLGKDSGKKRHSLPEFCLERGSMVYPNALWLVG